MASSATADVAQSSDGVFSIHGKGLKLNTREDMQPYIDVLDKMGDDNVREIRLGGNTLGVEACQALAESIKKQKSLQVRLLLSLSDEGWLWIKATVAVPGQLHTRLSASASWHTRSDYID